MKSITRDEFDRKADLRLKSLDLNGDGVVTRDEAQQRQYARPVRDPVAPEGAWGPAAGAGNGAGSTAAVAASSMPGRLEIPAAPLPRRIPVPRAAAARWVVDEKHVSTYAGRRCGRCCQPSSSTLVLIFGFARARRARHADHRHRSVPVVLPPRHRVDDGEGLRAGPGAAAVHRLRRRLEAGLHAVRRAADDRERPRPAGNHPRRQAGYRRDLQHPAGGPLGRRHAGHHARRHLHLGGRPASASRA